MRHNRSFSLLTSALKVFICTASFSKTTVCLSFSRPNTSQTATRLPFAIAASSRDDDNRGQVGSGPNWIERSFPVATDEKLDPKRVDDYNLGVSGDSYDTGPLSKRMYEAIVSKSSVPPTPQVLRTLKTYAMDFSAKEATRAALRENGLELTLTDDEQDQGMWGDVDSIRLPGIATVYDSWEESVDDWTPGEGFSFVVRQVPAKMVELSIDQLLASLDPDGSLRRETRINPNETEESDEADDAPSAVD